MRLEICKDRNTAVGEVHPASSCSSARRKRESTVTLRHNRNPIFFSISIIFLFFLFSFFSEARGGSEGPGETEIFVCLFVVF